MIIPTVTKRRLAEETEGEHMAANVTVFIHYEWEAIKTQSPEYIRTDYASLFLVIFTYQGNLNFTFIFTLCAELKKQT